MQEIKQKVTKVISLVSNDGKSTSCMQFTFSLKKKMFSSYFAIKTYCGYTLEMPHSGTSDGYQQHMFSWRNKKTIYLGLVVQN